MDDDLVFGGPIEDYNDALNSQGCLTTLIPCENLDSLIGYVDTSYNPYSSIFISLLTSLLAQGTTLGSHGPNDSLNLWYLDEDFIIAL